MKGFQTPSGSHCSLLLWFRRWGAFKFVDREPPPLQPFAKVETRRKSPVQPAVVSAKWTAEAAARGAIVCGGLLFRCP